MTQNCVFVSRDRRHALAGDLLFYHQPWVQRFPYHVMIYTGKDQLSGVFYAYNYGVEGDKPNLTVHLSFAREGVARGATKEEPFMLQTTEMALTIFDIPLSIANFKEPGNYKVTVKWKNRYGREMSYTSGFEGVVPYIERQYLQAETDVQRADIV
jgi:hypothetical protein